MKLQALFEVSLPKRASRYGVGKLMGYDLYFHKLYQNEIIPKSILSSAIDLANEFDYNLIKYNLKTNNITFIQSPDFDSAPEPTVGLQLLVKTDGTIKLMRPSSDPWIYHHKWLFVRDDYPGFDVNESKHRSEHWMSLPDVDYKRIGKKSFWEREVLPKLNY